jgi:hypothetical protein
MKRASLMSVWLIVGCSRGEVPTGTSDVPPVATGPLATQLIVSDPGAPLGPFASGTNGTPGLTTVAYVSLPPGALHDSVQVRIVNLRTAEVVTPTLTAGGFDPIGIAAVVGDMIDVVVEGSGGATHTRVPAVRVRPPRVVRTSPPKGQTDVPLNSVMVIVFSEPVDPATVTPLSIQLQNGGATIDGSLHFDDPQQLMATFVPAVPHPSHSILQLVITQAVRDLDGDPLETPVAVGFSTATDDGTPSLSGVAALAGDWDAVSWKFTQPGCTGRCTDDLIVGGWTDSGAWNGYDVRLSFTPVSDTTVHWSWHETWFIGGSAGGADVEGSANVDAATFQGVTEKSPWTNMINPCLYGFFCPLQDEQDFHRIGDVLIIDRRVDLLTSDGTTTPDYLVHETLTLRKRTQGP